MFGLQTVYTGKCGRQSSTDRKFHCPAAARLGSTLQSSGVSDPCPAWRSSC